MNMKERVETQLMPRLQQVAREPKIEELPLAEARTAYRRQTGYVGGEQRIAAVRDLHVDGCECSRSTTAWLPSAGTRRSRWTVRRRTGWALAHTAEIGTDPQRTDVGGDSAGGFLAAVTAIAAAREDLPCALQRLIYPLTDSRGGSPSRKLFVEGFFLTQQFLERGEEAWLPSGQDRADPGVSPVLCKDLPSGSPRRTSRRRASTRCATRERRVPPS